MSDLNTPKFMEFENGMRVINIANSMHNVSTIGFTVGSREDPEWFPGAAHIFEHEAIRGASDEYVRACLATGRPLPISGRELVRVMNQHLGGTDGDRMNVATWHSHMGFGHQDLPHRNDLHEVFLPFAASVRDSICDLFRMRGPQLLGREGHIVEMAAADNEGGIIEEDNFQLAYATALKLLYTTNPVRRFFDSHDAFTSVKLGRLKNWAQGKFHASTMVVIALGPTNNEILQLVRKAKLDELPKRKKTPLRVDPNDITPVLTDIKREFIPRPTATLTHVMLMWPTEPFLTKDQRALEVLSYVLKHRVEDELRENNKDLPGGVYHPACSWDGTSTHGYFTLWFATRRELAYAEVLLARILTVIENLKQDVTSLLEEDVGDFRWYLWKEFTTAYRYAPSDIVDLVLEAVSNGDPHLTHFQAYPKAIRRVTAAQVRKVANKYLHTDRFVQATLWPAP